MAEKIPFKRLPRSCVARNDETLQFTVSSLSGQENILSKDCRAPASLLLNETRKKRQDKRLKNIRGFVAVQFTVSSLS